MGLLSTDQKSDGIQVKLYIHVITGNEQPPTIQLTGHIQVEEKDTTEIPASIFNLNDPDTPLDSLVIIVAEPPTNGNHIVKCNLGMDVILEAGDTITPQELKDGKVRFIHNSPVLSAGKSL